MRITQEQLDRMDLEKLNEFFWEDGAPQKAGEYICYVKFPLSGCYKIALVKAVEVRTLNSKGKWSSSMSYEADRVGIPEESIISYVPVIDRGGEENAENH